MTPGPIGDAAYLSSDALVALRNSRLWEAHAERSAGAERDHAQWAASQWSSSYQMLTATAPGKRRIPMRRGAVEKASVGRYVYLVVMGGMMLFVLGSAVWRLFS
ncbi:hypothetical protein BVU76_19035 [Mycolicibacterium porcinum]|nr:hypothetical protein BVU76_19035 [Mycolicibacterium porcinum]